MPKRDCEFGRLKNEKRSSTCVQDQLKQTGTRECILLCQSNSKIRSIIIL